MNTSPTANGRLSPIFSFGNTKGAFGIEQILSGPFGPQFEYLRDHLVRTPRRFIQVAAIDVAIWPEATETMSAPMSAMGC